ncbi:major facilitator superfamily domain-containing protein [Xylariaceae sp. FL1272]|nr:major facilitator superfamily domain-containing protein [Xylariaceae sp. FL1272]
MSEASDKYTTPKEGASDAIDTSASMNGEGKVKDLKPTEAQLDEAVKYLNNVGGQYEPMTPEVEARIVKKIDCWMVALLLFAATLGAVDKVELGTAALYGFRDDVHLVGQQYSWLGSILSLGSLSGYFVTIWLVQRVPPAKLLCYSSLAWSVLTVLYPAGRNWSDFMALRFFMGFIEASITPCITMLIATFYKKTEQPARNAICLAYFSSVFNGFFAWLVGLIPASAPLYKWQYLYLITGSINILYSLFLLCFLPDSPMKARFLSEKEKCYAVQRLASNRTGIANHVWKWGQAREALLDPRIWLIFFFNIFINIPNGGLVSFGSIIIGNLGFSALVSSLLTIPFGVLATSSAWVFSFWAQKWHNRRSVSSVPIVACVALLLPIIGTVVIYVTPRTNVPAQLVALYFMYFYWPPYIIGVSLPQANTAGQTKKSVAFSVVQFGYAVGNLIGPQTFLSWQAPKYRGAIIAMLTSYAVCVVIMLAYLALGTWENKRRDRKYGKPEEVHQGTVEGFVDVSDMQQTNFRYTT